MAEQQIEVCPVSCKAFAVVIERKDGSIWERNPADGLAPAIITIFVFIDVITQVQHIVHRVLSGWITKGIEESEGEVAARINSKTNFSDKIIGCRRGLSASNWARDVGIADTELVIISCVGTEILSFNLSSPLVKYIEYAWSRMLKHYGPSKCSRHQSWCKPYQNPSHLRRHRLMQPCSLSKLEPLKVA